MDNKKIGKFIAQRRKQLSMTQQNLADQLGITNKAVSKWETGEGYPDITVLPALAEILEVTIDELLKGEKNDSVIEAGEPYRIKETAQQANYILEKSIRHFDNQYLICIGILMAGVIASSLSLKLYIVYLPSSVIYPIIISLAFLIFGLLFYKNICKGFENDIRKYNLMVGENKYSFSQTMIKKHLIFYAVYLIPAVILIGVIPLHPYRCIGYYAAMKKISGFSSNNIQYLIDAAFCDTICVILYFILLALGLWLITKKMKSARKNV